MPGVTVNEPLNPSAWTKEQQEEMYAVLAELLGVQPEPGCDYSSMSDEELSASLQALSAEMKNRPAAITELQECTQFYDDTIVTPVVESK